jgi:hypothetical protein
LKSSPRIFAETVVRTSFGLVLDPVPDPELSVGSRCAPMVLG